MPRLHGSPACTTPARVWFFAILLAIAGFPQTPLSAHSVHAYAAAPAAGTKPTKAERCQRPPDDYNRTTINGEPVNARTLWMLQLADLLYKGPGSPLRVTQGSYTDTLDVSFGTHAGGGVVDVSIRAKAAPHKMLGNAEANKIVRALRAAGFAAWLRLPGDLDPPAPIHIHAVAVGDKELSDAARRQLYGPEGYFEGFDGVPPEQGGTQRDRLGGPVICDWMIQDGLVKP